MSAAKEYARAIFSLANEMDNSELCLDELTSVCTVLDQNPDYIKLLSTPALPKDKKTALIDEAFSALNINVLNMLKLLCESRSVGLVYDIKREYQELYDGANGIVRVSATTAVPMSDGTVAALKSKLEVSLKAKIILECHVDKSILGGIILRYSGIQTDASVKARLDSLAKSIKNIIV